MPKLNKRERNFISPMIKFGWALHTYSSDIGCWDGDWLDKVKLGNMVKNLEKNGYIFRTGIGYAATAKLRSLTCNYCYKGNIYDSSDKEIGVCSNCQGTCIDLTKD